MGVGHRWLTSKNCDQCVLALCYNRVEGRFGGHKILILFV